MTTHDTLTKSTLRVSVDIGSCCGYGVCAAICPEVYKRDDAGLVVLESEFVPPGLEDAAREGAEACPQACLHLEVIED